MQRRGCPAGPAIPRLARGDRRAQLLSLVAALLHLALAGCYDTPRPACAFACSGDGDCPGGYSCRADTWCKRDDVADDFACGPDFPDAAAPSDAGGTTADAALPDASLPDASTDAPAQSNTGWHKAAGEEDAPSSTISGTTDGTASGSAS